MYQNLSKELLSKWNGFKIAITGTNGKTTVKEISKTILEEKYDVLSTKGNENNQIGVPKTIFKLKKSNEVIILEMGAGKRGDIYTLSSIVQPHISIITNIGNSHSKYIGNIEDISLEKRDILSFFNEKDRVILDKRNNFYKKLTEKLLKEQIITFDCISNPEFLIVEDKKLLGYKLLYKNEVVNFSLIGKVNLRNLHFGIFLAYQMDMKKEEIKNGIEKIKRIPMRLDILKNESFLILTDAYNSNISSLREGLEIFSKVEKTDFIKVVKKVYKNFRKIIILSDILELSKIERQITYKEVNKILKNIHLDALFTIGLYMKKVGVKLKEENRKILIKSYDETEINVFSQFLKNYLLKGDFLYLKGSRFYKLHEFSEYIIREF